METRMKKCPCCDKDSLNDEQVMNALSHIDNKTYICNDCGNKESLVNLDPSSVDQVDFDIYERFKMSLRGEAHV